MLNIALNRWLNRCGISVLALGMLCCGELLLAQPVPVAGPAPVAKVVAPAGDKAEKEDDYVDPSEKTFPGGAPLKTDPEQQRLLKKADLCVSDGRLDLAVVLWQKVLDEAGDTLMTRDGRLYFTLSDEVERTLAALPADALRVYRLLVDGEAQAMLSKATSQTEEDLLGQIVRRYFLSEHGDDAAYKLGCLALDRYDFIGASRMFGKILERHPDPSIPRTEILLRLAIASARIGDRPGAAQWLESLARAPGPRPDSAVLDAVLADIEQTLAGAATVQTSERDWRMPYGGPARIGFQPALPAAAMTRDLTELWSHNYPLEMKPGPGNGRNNGVIMVGPGMFMSRSGGGRQPPAPVSLEHLVSQWRQHGWTPAGQLLFEDGRVYLKTTNSLLAFSTTALSDQVVWRPAWLNEYQPDGMSGHMAMMAMSYGMNLPSRGLPQSSAEVFLFGDRVHQGMSIHNGLLYTLEGRRYDADVPPPATPFRQPQWGVVPRRTRSNWLTAYRSKGGSVVWHRAASDEDKEGAQDVGFMAAPMPFGNLLLAPVTDGGAIWLCGLSAEREGQTIWRTYLCDEPAGGCAPWSPVMVAVDGRDAYVNCGAGVVFAVDAASGAVRWAARYKRDMKPNTALQNIYGNQFQQQEANGWDDDLVIPYGKLLVVIASDYDRIFALDRRTGQLEWESSPRTSPFGPVARYCLGVNGRSLFVAGKSDVRCYDMPSGKLTWEKSIGDSFGRGMLTADSVYVPVRDSILKLDLKTGADLAQVGVALTTDEPVGNLYSDGEKFWVVGAGRIYTMTSVELRFSMLEKQIAAGDAEAQLNRMRLHFKQKRLTEALTDLRGAYALFRKNLTPDDAADRFFDAAAELKLVYAEPKQALELLAELFAGESPPPISEAKLGRRNDMLTSSLSSIRQAKVAGAAQAVLKVAPLLAADHLVQLASQALSASAQASDLPLLEAASRGVPTLQLVAAPALQSLGGDAAKPLLAKYGDSTDERVKLAGARALAGYGDRGCFPKLLALLEAQDAKVRQRTHQTLRALTGVQTIQFAGESPPETRTAGIAAWKAWVDKESAVAKLALPLPDADLLLGRTLYISYNQSQVTELNADRSVRWRASVPNPWGCQGLPNGHRLIASHSQNTVIEFDENGKEVWRVKNRLPTPPYSVQRLENGNTLVCCADINQILEIAPDGKTTTATINGRPMSARRLPNGNTLVALQQESRLVELDSSNKVVWEAKNIQNPMSAERLDNGRTLVACASGQVLEIDNRGQTVWSAAIRLPNPTSVQRLPNGNTLVGANDGLHELDIEGKKVVNKQQAFNVSGVSHF